MKHRRCFKIRKYRRNKKKEKTGDRRRKKKKVNKSHFLLDLVE